jgi:hypothetical protein
VRVNARHDEANAALKIEPKGYGRALECSIANPVRGQKLQPRGNRGAIAGPLPFVDLQE